MDTERKLALCKAAAQAILADARITDRERGFLDRLMDHHALDPAQRKEVLRRNLGDDPVALLHGFDDPESRREALREVTRAVVVDGVLAPAEEELLAQIAKAFGIPASEVEDLIADGVMDQ